MGLCQEPIADAEYRYPHYYLSRVVEIPAYNEQAVFEALQQGPVSVGLCGTDENFLFYSSGIFNDINCCDTQNHAFLIVGYGFDKSLSAAYWIAQNR